MEVEQAYQILYSIALLALAPMIGLAMYRTVKGPRITDRLVAVNMIGTMVIAAFLMLIALLQESYLADVALIYALISFVSVLIFAAVYIRRKKEER